MKREKSTVKLLFLFGIDTICNIISFYIGILIRYGSLSHSNMTGVFQREIFLFIILISAVIHLVIDPSRNYMHRTVLQELFSVLRYNAIFISALVLLVFTVHHTEYISRLVIGYFLIADTLLMFAARGLIKVIIRAIYKNNNVRTNVVLITQASNASEVKESFSSGATYHICGHIVVDKGKAEGTVNDMQISSPFSELANNLVQHSFDEVFICLPGYTMKDLEDFIVGIEDMGVICHYALTISNEKVGKGTFQVYGNYPVISYSITEPNHFGLAIKRIFDIVGGIIGVFITAILFLFLAPAIKLESKGPVFFSQTRVGKNGRKFTFYKFRSMVEDAESKKLELMSSNEMNSTLMFKIKDDPRITKVGSFIRKTSLDEFPQFWNVLKGDMSIVGTRPPTVEEYEQYDEHYRRRLSMLPGITGLWQVSGRSTITDFNEVIKLDLEYIDNWSLMLDASILLKTFGVLFTRKGAS